AGCEPNATTRTSAAPMRAASSVTRSRRPRRSVTGQPSLRNDVIRTDQDRLGDRQAESLRRLEVDDQFELCRLLDREVSRVRPFQVLVHIGGGAAIKICTVRAVAQEAARLHVFSRSEHRWQLMRQRELGELLCPAHEQRGWKNQNPAGAVFYSR